MDCMDCHNRPSHSFDLPERGVDKAMNNGLISATLPFAKKQARGDPQSAVPFARRGRRRRSRRRSRNTTRTSIRPSGRSARRRSRHRRKEVLAVYDRNVFPEMKVTWGAYPSTSGTTISPAASAATTARMRPNRAIRSPQDCNACHNLLAQDERSQGAFRSGDRGEQDGPALGHLHRSLVVRMS